MAANLVSSGGQSSVDRTIFISSRMEELALDRRTAFDAAYLAGFVPLLFENEPRGKDEKSKIDTLVDSSDYFLGLYHQSIGTKSENLCGLEPIRYELYRFLLRFADTEIAHALVETGGAITAGVKELLDHRMRDRTALAKLRRRILTEGLESCGGQRVLLYRKMQSYDSATSVSLEVMLADFDHCRVFQSRRREPPKFLEHLPPSDDEESFQTARFDLFAQVFEELGKRRSPQGSGATRQDHQNGGEWWRLTGDDDTGILFRILQRLFQKGMNIDFLCAGPPFPSQGRQGSVVIDLVVRPFYPSAQAKATRKALEVFKKWESRDGNGKKLMKIEAKRTSVPRTKNMNEPRSPHLYKIETADVPGMALRIAERIVRYHGAIESYFLDTSQLVDRVGYGKGLAAHFVAITPVDDKGGVTDSAWEEAKMVQFEMDLQQGLGIQRFQRIPSSAEFMDGIRASEPGSSRYHLAGAEVSR